MGIRTFVVWDSTIASARTNLPLVPEELGDPSHTLDVLGLTDTIEHGGLYTDILKPRLGEADRILALGDPPGANMTFELG